MLPNEPLSAEQALETLREIMLCAESETARLNAAKVLLERLAPKEDDESKKREAEEREAALAEARGFLAEFAALRLASLHEPRAVDQPGEAAATDAAG